jgi:hypothetical protein
MIMKQFWKSKTIWGIVISLLPTILQVAGIPLPIGEVLNQVIIAAGGGLAVVGRVKAVDRLVR